MELITTNIELPDDGGVKLINIDPKSGTFEIYKQNPDGTYPVTPFKSVTSSSEPKDTIFYAPTPKGLIWKVVLIGGAEAEYTRHATRNS